MDKRFLFRGKRVDNGEWAYGLLAKSRADLKEADSIVLDDWFENDMGMVLGHREKVDPITIGQCTGLTAAKSYRGDGEDERLVFEGDIVELRDGGKACTGQVIWDGNCYSFGTIIKEEYQSRLEIIGNIHDHPELLGGEKGE